MWPQDCPFGAVPGLNPWSERGGLAWRSESVWIDGPLPLAAEIFVTYSFSRQIFMKRLPYARQGAGHQSDSVYQNIQNPCSGMLTNYAL